MAQNFKQIIENVLEPYKAKFAEMTVGPPKATSKQKAAPVLTKEEIESERNRLLAESVPPDVFTKVVGMMNEAANRSLPAKPLAHGGPVTPQKYLVGERGPEGFVQPNGRFSYIGVNGPSIFTPPTPGIVVPNNQLPIPRQLGGIVDPREKDKPWTNNPLISANYAYDASGKMTSPLSSAYRPSYMDAKPGVATGMSPFQGSPLSPFKGERAIPKGFTSAFAGSEISPFSSERNAPTAMMEAVQDAVKTASKKKPGEEEEIIQMQGGGVVDPWEELAEKEAEKYKLPAGLATSFMRTENRWAPGHVYNPNLVSKKGAQGLFQIMPSNYERYNLTEPFNPNENIRAGVNLLSDMYKEHGGDFDKTVAAWNYGSGNMRKTPGWLPDETKQFQNLARNYWNEWQQKPTMTMAQETPIPQRGRPGLLQRAKEELRPGIAYGQGKGVFQPQGWNWTSPYDNPYEPGLPGNVPTEPFGTPLPRDLDPGIWAYRNMLKPWVDIYKKGIVEPFKENLAKPIYEGIRDFFNPNPNVSRVPMTPGEEPTGGYGLYENVQPVSPPSGGGYMDVNAPEIGRQPYYPGRLEAPIPKSIPSWTYDREGNPIPVYREEQQREIQTPFYAIGPKGEIYPTTREEFNKGHGASWARDEWEGNQPVEMILGSPYAGTWFRGRGGTQPIEIPQGQHLMAGREGPEFTEKYKQRWGMGEYAPDYKPQLAVGYDEKGNHVVKSFNPKTKAWDVVTSGSMPKEQRTPQDDWAKALIDAYSKAEFDADQGIGVNRTPERRALEAERSAARWEMLQERLREIYGLGNAVQGQGRGTPAKQDRVVRTGVDNKTGRRVNVYASGRVAYAD